MMALTRTDREGHTVAEQETLKDTFVGRTLGGSYLVQRLIGEGGMGQVYEASHTRVQRSFAIKVLNVRLTKLAEVRARFEREAMLGSRLGHDHIVAVIDFDNTDDGYPFLVMELLQGQDLGQAIIRQGTIEPVRAVSIVRQVADALMAAHSEGVVHRDLKPENIFLCQRKGGGELVKAMDFGISKVLTSESIVTSHQTVLGTPWYMAPEQALGKVQEVDHRSDLFSLGLIFYHMLSGKMPYEGDSVPSILYQVVHEEPPPLKDIAPHLPEALLRIVNKAISKDKIDRYQSAEELVADLEQAMGAQWKEVLLHELKPVQEGERAAGDAAGDVVENPAMLDTMASPDLARSGTEPAVRPKEVGTAPTVQVVDSLPGGGESPVTTTLSRTTGELKQGDPSRQPQRRSSSVRLALGAGAVIFGLAALTLVLVSGGEEMAKPAPSSEAVTAAKSTPSPQTEITAKPAPFPQTEIIAKPAPPPRTESAEEEAVAPSRKLSVVSKPAGALVKINGAKAGKSPLRELDAPFTALKVEVRKPGYAAVTKTVGAGRDAEELTVTLRPLPASLNVVALFEGESMGADIYLDGKKVDRTPAVIPNLKPGRHTIRLVKKGFKTATEKVTLRPGQRRRVAVGLRR